MTFIGPQSPPIVERIYELESRRLNYKDIAEVLEAEGWPSPTGEPWTYQAVTSILVKYRVYRPGAMVL